MTNEDSKFPTFKNESQIKPDRSINARKEGLTKGALTTGIISFILLIVLGVIVYSLYKKEQNEQLALMEQQKNTFSKQLTERDSTINDWLVTFDQIEKDMVIIKEKENLVTIKSSDSEFSKNRKEQIFEDIKYINMLLDNNKKKIASLNAQLKQSGKTMKGLQDRIATLEASIGKYDTEMSELKTTLAQKDFQIGELNTKVTVLDQTITQKNDTISHQIQKLHQAYIAYGTFKDLKEKGILSKEGGFLGLGRKESLMENSPDSLFKEIDVTETKTIPVNSKNAKLITEHPNNSYEMIHSGDNKIAYLEIKDPEQFWKISKYAVVEIIK